MRQAGMRNNASFFLCGLWRRNRKRQTNRCRRLGRNRRDRICSRNPSRHHKRAGAPPAPFPAGKRGSPGGRLAEEEPGPRAAAAAAWPRPRGGQRPQAIWGPARSSRPCSVATPRFPVCKCESNFNRRPFSLSLVRLPSLILFLEGIFPPEKRSV